MPAVQSIVRNDLYVELEWVVNIGLLSDSHLLAQVPLAQVQLEILATVSEAERRKPAPWRGCRAYGSKRPQEPHHRAAADIISLITNIFSYL